MQYLIYLHIMGEFIPINSTGRATATNSISISTALLMISTMHDSGRQFIIFKYRRQAKSLCSPSSWLMSSIEKHSPGSSPLFFSQMIAQNDPQKKMPSIATKVIIHSAKEACSVSHH